ncbi:MAG: hypothetical protein CMA63_06805 [Euryarchaeota archaeon]|nr:hypothetical protein [Euryarchaeota archaeon]
MFTKEVEVRVGSEFEIARQDLPTSMEQTLRQLLTFDNPDHVKRSAMNVRTHNIPHRVSFARSDGSILRIARGALDILRRVADRCGVSLRFINETMSSRGSTLSMEELSIDLRPYQKEAVNSMIQRVQGYVRLPCGAGKTVLGCAAVLMTGESTIVIVHTIDLAMQWADTFSKLYGRKVRTHQSFRPLKSGEIAVVMVQAIHNAGRASHALLQSAGCVLLDECHHAPASTFRAVFENCSARFRWGLTATPERADGWTFALPLVIGPELYGMTTSDLLNLGHLVKPSIIAVITRVPINFDDHTNRSGRLNMSSAVSALCEDEGRNELLAGLAKSAASNGRTVLLLVPRKALAHSLATTLCERGVSAVALSSSVSKTQREGALRALRERRIQVAVATQLADEGLDVPVLDTLINASTGRAAGRAIQRVGRVLRKAADKRPPLVIEIVDPGPFRSQWKSRRIAYREQLSIEIEHTMDVRDLEDLRKIEAMMVA